MRNGERRRSCRCAHADLGRVRQILAHVFFRRELPDGITAKERTLLVGKLVYHVPHGNGFGCASYCLTGRGEEILMELDTRRTTQRKEAMV
jgi:hypothetical protein